MHNASYIIHCAFYLNMKLIVGLGNPGKDYIKTRHNIGFIIVDYIFDKFKNNFPPLKEERKFKAQISIGEINGDKIILAKPLTFMNLSGFSIKEISKFYKINPKDILIIQDDKDMELLKIRIKKEASGDGGHNGIKSIIQELGTKELNRFKIGVGNELLERMPTDKFVLGQFTKEESNKIRDKKEEIIEKVLETIK